MGIENYGGFVLAALLLNLTPGADTVYILSRSLHQGRAAGVASVLGIAGGIVVHIVLVALGLAQLVARSPLLFAVLQYAGAAYLLWLGVQMWRSGGLGTGGAAPPSAPWGKVFRQGVLTNLLNPKIALFFLALLPQFVRPEAAAQMMPYLLLGGTFVVSGTLWCLVLVWGADGIRRLLVRRPQAAVWINRVCGGLLVGLGVKVALGR